MPVKAMKVAQLKNCVAVSVSFVDVLKALILEVAVVVAVLVHLAVMLRTTMKDGMFVVVRLMVTRLVMYEYSIDQRGER